MSRRAPFLAAVVQAAPVVFDLERSVQKACDLIADAGRQGARVIVLPEAFLSAYPQECDFGARFGYRTAAGRDQFARYWHSAIDSPGPVVERLAAAARAAAAYVVIGVIERDADYGRATLYCTVLFFGPDGSALGKHRKLMPTAFERLTWGFGDGSTMPVFDTPHGRLGAVICWENYMPLMRMAMYAKGIELYCAPTADDLDTWADSMRHIAFEGGCFVLSSCQYLTRADCPADYPDGGRSDADTVFIRGGSMIVAPRGRMLVPPNYDGERVLLAELDPEDIPRSRYDFDVTGHYARPDVFQLRVDERPKPPVVTRGADAGEFEAE